MQAVLREDEASYSVVYVKDWHARGAAGSELALGRKTAVDQELMYNVHNVIIMIHLHELFQLRFNIFDRLKTVLDQVY